MVYDKDKRQKSQDKSKSQGISHFFSLLCEPLWFSGFSLPPLKLRQTSLCKFLFFVLFLVRFQPAGSQSLDYGEIFGEDWVKAEAFEMENRGWIDSALRKNHISYPLAISVIFPELVRYSALRDKMEISLLKTLYINLGDDYANFSIGVFQMKPSFAELIREDAPKIAGHRKVLQDKSRFSDIKEFRKSIVNDLENPKTQIYYLIAFMKLCEVRYKSDSMDTQSQVKFLATVYNFGIDKTESEIDSMSDKKFFNTKIFSTKNYSYPDISLYWYNQFISRF